MFNGSGFRIISNNISYEEAGAFAQYTVTLSRETSGPLQNNLRRLSETVASLGLVSPGAVPPPSPLVTPLVTDKTHAASLSTTTQAWHSTERPSAIDKDVSHIHYAKTNHSKNSLKGGKGERGGETIIHHFAIAPPPMHKSFFLSIDWLKLKVSVNCFKQCGMLRAFIDLFPGLYLTGVMRGLTPQQEVVDPQKVLQNLFGGSTLTP